MKRQNFSCPDHLGRCPSASMRHATHARKEGKEAEKESARTQRTARAHRTPTPDTRTERPRSPPKAPPRPKCQADIGQPPRAHLRGAVPANRTHRRCARGDWAQDTSTTVWSLGRRFHFLGKTGTPLEQLTQAVSQILGSRYALRKTHLGRQRQVIAPPPMRFKQCVVGYWSARLP